MYKKGTIILVPFPFTDLSNSKVRPALIISNNLRGDDIIVVFISSTSAHLGKYDVAVKASKQNGLKKDSRIKCSKIATLDKKIILGELGNMTSDEEKKIDSKLKTLFNL